MNHLLKWSEPYDFELLGLLNVAQKEITDDIIKGEYAEVIKTAKN